MRRDGQRYPTARSAQCVERYRSWFTTAYFHHPEAWVPIAPSPVHSRHLGRQHHRELPSGKPQRGPPAAASARPSPQASRTVFQAANKQHIPQNFAARLSRNRPVFARMALRIARSAVARFWTLEWHHSTVPGDRPQRGPGRSRQQATDRCGQGIGVVGGWSGVAGRKR